MKGELMCGSRWTTPRRSSEQGKRFRDLAFEWLLAEVGSREGREITLWFPSLRYGILTVVYPALIKSSYRTGPSFR